MRILTGKVVAGICCLVTTEIYALEPQKTILAFHTISPAGQLVTDTAPASLEKLSDRFTFAQVAPLDARPHLVGVNCNTGRIKVYGWTEAGLGKAVSEYQHVNFRCSAVTLAATPLGPYLFLLDSFRGRIQRIRVLPTGELDFITTIAFQSSLWLDKNIFASFTQGGNWRLYGMNTWSGAVVVADFNGAVVGQTVWSRGYTSVDHIEISPTVTYRVLYKAAGDPYEPDVDDGPGLLVVQRVSTNGLNLGNTYSGTTDPGFSHVRFLPRVLDNGTTQQGLFFYNRKTGAFRVRLFSAGGTPSFIVATSGNAGKGWVDFQPFYASRANRLLALNDENVAPFNYDEVKRFGQEIHDELQGKAIGYQLMVAQSGRVIFSRAWGHSKLDANPAKDIPMTIRTPHDLGSAGKMITTMTALKLADQGVRGLSVGDGLANRLVSVPPKSWVFTRTIWNLLTHTTGMRNQPDVDDACADAPGYRKDCTPFFEAEPTDGFDRVYNNSNTVALRKVIEWATLTETSPEITAETYKAWASALHLDLSTTGEGASGNAMTCRVPADVYYFARCTDGEECYFRNGRYWKQAKLADPDQEWTFTCSAGGWMASSRQLIEFLFGIRYEKVLSPNMNNLLLATNLTDGSEKATAVGWEPPWDAGDGLGNVNLGKNGAVPGNGVATNAYITRLPANVEAVLLVNSAAPGPTGLVRAVYKRSVGLTEDSFNYSDLVFLGRKQSSASGVDNLAAGTLASGQATYQAANANYMIGMRDGNGWLRLTGFHVTAEGAVEERGTSGLAVSIKSVAITDGNAFASAVITNTNLLRVDGWTIDGAQPDTINHQGSSNGQTATKAVITKVAGTGTSTGRVVTAIRRTNGDLRLDAWDLNNLADTVTNTGSFELGSIANVAIETLVYRNSLNDTSRVVTAVHNGQDRLQLDTWDIAPNGQPTRNPGTLVTAIDLGGTARPISIRRLSNLRFFASFVDATGNLGVATFTVAANGAVSLEESLIKDAATDQVANSASLTATRLANGELVLRQWRLSAGAGIAELATEKLDAVSGLAATGGTFVAYTAGANNDLIVRNYEFVD